jgi:cyclophilin family peptidyl-prolyl cis-trans isomerase/HEAT repeat protein
VSVVRLPKSIAVFAAVAACSRTADPPLARLARLARLAGSIDAGAGAPSGQLLAAIARAEDQRRAADLTREVQDHHDPVVRRAAARALARILDPDDTPLLRALEDDDPETVAWAGYGLGESCKGREDAHVRALAARAASLPPGPSAEGALDPIPTLVRAIGRCGGDQAEPALRAWLRAGGRPSEAAAYALGDVAGRAGLATESSGALLGASLASPSLAAALYPFSRGEGIAPDGISARLVAAARAALGRPGPERIFAVRALGRAGDPRAADDLSRVLSSDDFTPAERVEAAHALGRLHKPGQVALADALGVVVGDGAAIEGALASDRFSVALATLGAAGDDLATRSATALWAIARLDPGPGAAPPRVRRASALRCAAAEKLARGAWDSDVLRGCDLGDGEAGEHARLASLERAPLVRARRAAWLELTRSTHVRVREAALAAAGRHPELGDAARTAIAEGLAAEAPGVVATAASLVQSHPELVFVLAASERRAALDPASPPPSTTPARSIERSVGSALRAALARAWAPDLVETRVALLDAAVAAGLAEGRAAATVACGDANATIRARASKALAAAGDTQARCPAPDAAPSPAPEVDHALDHAVRVDLDTESGMLAVRLDPRYAPVAVTRLVALARSGFYTGLTFHRVVPGFVAQAGDRGGDGYGGAGALLRCETAPVAFGPLDVGVALAGRDTGSSQFFVALAKSPHLDGEYSWIGRAEGDWGAVAEGDVIRAVHVEE